MNIASENSNNTDTTCETIDNNTSSEQSERYATGTHSNTSDSKAQNIVATDGKNLINREFTAIEVQQILRILSNEEEKIGLALLNYYARSNLVPSTGKEKSRGRKKYTYADLVLLCWLFRMKREGLPVNRFRRGIDYLRKRLPRLHKDPSDMVLLTDGRQLFIKHRVEDKGQIAEVLTGKKAGQYVWAYAIGSLIEEVDRIIDELESKESKNSINKNTSSRVAA